MERLTEKRDGQNVIPLRQDGKTKWALSCAGMGDAPTQFLYGVHADKLAEYEDLEDQGKLLILAYEIVEVPDCPHCGHTKWKVKEVMIQPRLLDYSMFFKTQEEAEAALKEVEHE